MSTAVKILALVYGAILFTTFVVLSRKKSVKPFYTTLWLIISLFMFSFVLFENTYRSLAASLRIENATTFVIVGLISFLLIYVLYLSLKISELSNRTMDLISHASILEKELRDIKKTGGSGDRPVYPGIKKEEQGS